MNLGRPFNSARDDEYLRTTSDDLWGYFASDRRDRSSVGRFDLYRTRLPGWLRDPVDILFTGLVMDGRTRLALGVSATIKIHFDRRSLVTISRVFQKPPGPQATNFRARLSSGRTYKVEISAPGFLPQTIALDYTGPIPSSRIDRRVIVLQPIPKKTIPVRPATRLLTGRIIDAQTKRGIGGSVATLRQGAMEAKTYRTDGTGAFRFKVRMEKDGKARLAAIGRAKGYAVTRKMITISPLVKSIVIELKRGKAPQDRCKQNLEACLDDVKIYFRTDSAAIPASERAKLATVLRVMKLHRKVKIEVFGNTDARGSQAYNRALSMRRARAVRNALAKLGVAANRLKLTPNGKLRPVCRARTPQCYRKNRRVEFKRLGRVNR